MVYLILILYFALTFAIGIKASQQGENTPESYFLSNRNVSTFTLFFTLIATNFSAFFFLGFAGEGYKIGYAYYAMISFGTSFAALSFYLVGNRAYHLGKKHGYITPVEMIRDLSGSKILSLVFLGTMIVFMVPYLAVQPIGAGLILSSLTDGAISFEMGASLLTLFIIRYVLVGGMRGITSIDVKNGILMLCFMVIAVLIVAKGLGGMTFANTSLFESDPGLFSPKGKGGHFTPQKWISFVVLWMACIPMFPQIFMRFLISKDLQSFKTSSVLYALIPAFLFLLPIIIGVLGHLSFPGLEGKSADKILSLMLVEHAVPSWLSALILTGALAAFMSTMDSILLAISTLVTRDIYLPYFAQNKDLANQVKVGKIAICFFALFSLGISVFQPASIFQMVKMTFTGVAILFPVTLAIFYWKKTNPLACVVGIFLGLLYLVSVQFGWLSKDYLFGFEAVVPVLSICIFCIVIGSFLKPRVY